MVLTAATCSLIGVHLLADDGAGDSAAIGWALGVLLVLLGLLWVGMAATRRRRGRTGGQAPGDLPDDYRRC